MSHEIECPRLGCNCPDCNCICVEVRQAVDRAHGTFAATDRLMRRYLDMVNRVLAHHKPMKQNPDQCRICDLSGYPCVTIKVMTGEIDAPQ